MYHSYCQHQRHSPRPSQNAPHLPQSCARPRRLQLNHSSLIPRVRNQLQIFLLLLHPQRSIRPLDVLRQPADSLTVALSHDNRAHENLDRPDALERHLALARCLVEAEFVSELVLGDGVGVCETCQL